MFFEDYSKVSSLYPMNHNLSAMVFGVRCSFPIRPCTAAKLHIMCVSVCGVCVRLGGGGEGGGVPHPPTHTRMLTVLSVEQKPGTRLFMGSLDHYHCSLQVHIRCDQVGVFHTTQ